MSPLWRCLIGATLLLSPAAGCTARDASPVARAVDTARSAPAPSSGIAERRGPATVETSRGAATRGAPPRAPAHRAAPSPAPIRAGPRRVMLGTLDLTGVGHDAGSATAPVVLIDFSDFGCPYCGQFTRETWPVIERDYVRTGKVFFKYVPFIVGTFPHAAEAARAAECAAEQGRFWEMADHVYEAQSSWKGRGDPRPLLTGIAAVVGADTVAFSRCFTDRRTEPRTARANDVAATIGVRVTPSFLVNERPIQGALPLADFRRVLDAALLVAGARR